MSNKFNWSGPGWYARNKDGQEQRVPATKRMNKGQFWPARRYAERQAMRGVRWLDIQPIDAYGESDE